MDFVPTSFLLEEVRQLIDRWFMIDTFPSLCEYKTGFTHPKWLAGVWKNQQYHFGIHLWNGKISYHSWCFSIHLRFGHLFQLLVWLNSATKFIWTTAFWNKMHFSKVTNMSGNMGRTVQILYQVRSSFKSPHYDHSIGTKWKTLKKFW